MANKKAKPKWLGLIQTRIWMDKAHPVKLVERIAAMNTSESHHLDGKVNYRALRRAVNSKSPLVK